MTPAQKFNLFALVFHPDPARGNHAGLFFEIPGKGRGSLYHARPTNNGVEMEVVQGYSPINSTNLSVAEVSITLEELHRLLAVVPVASGLDANNSVAWCDAALHALKDTGYISQKSYTQGIEGILDITLPA